MLEISSAIPSVSTKVTITVLPLEYICSGKRTLSRVLGFFTLLPQLCSGTVPLARMMLRKQSLAFGTSLQLAGAFLN